MASCPSIVSICVSIRMLAWRAGAMFAAPAISSHPDGTVDFFKQHSGNLQLDHVIFDEREAGARKMPVNGSPRIVGWRLRVMGLVGGPGKIQVFNKGVSGTCTAAAANLGCLAGDGAGNRLSVAGLIEDWDALVADGLAGRRGRCTPGADDGLRGQGKSTAG